MTKAGFIIFLALVTFALTAAAYICYLTYQEDYAQETTIETSQKP